MRLFFQPVVAAFSFGIAGFACAAGGESAIKLTGIVHVAGRNCALLEFTPAGRSILIRPILTGGERIEGVEVTSIDERAGTVALRQNGQPLTLTLDDGAAPAMARNTLNLKGADSRAVFDVYQKLAGRTVLLSPRLPGIKMNLRSEGPLSADAAADALERAFAEQQIAIQPHGATFAFALPVRQIGTLKEIRPLPDPAQERAGEVLPAGLVKFQEGDLAQVLDVYQELVGRTLIRPQDLPPCKISIRSETPLSREEVIWALDALLRMRDVMMVKQGEKFVFALPASRLVPFLDRGDKAFPPRADARKVANAGEMKFVDARLQQVLEQYARLLECEPLPLDATTPQVRFNLRVQSPLTIAEAIYALDALAAVNNLRFVLVGDKQVKVVPAPPPRRPLGLNPPRLERKEA